MFKIGSMYSAAECLLQLFYPTLYLLLLLIYTSQEREKFDFTNLRLLAAVKTRAAMNRIAIACGGCTRV
jgi:hypothetical protein